MWRIDAATARAFAHAYGDTYGQEGQDPSLAPPMALVIGTIGHGVGPLIQTLLGQGDPMRLRALVHREEAIVWHAPLRIDVPMHVHAQVRTHDVRRVGEFVHVRTTVTSHAGKPIATSESGLFVRPLALASAQAILPTHPAAQGPPWGRPLPSWHVADDAPNRYAAASQENNPIHLDDAVARSVGLPGRILHGLCTMAYSARSVLAQAPSNPPVRLHKLAARFVKPVFLQDTLTCRVHNEGPFSVAFDVVQQSGHVVLGRGAAEFLEL